MRYRRLTTVLTLTAALSIASCSGSRSASGPRRTTSSRELTELRRDTVRETLLVHDTLRETERTLLLVDTAGRVLARTTEREREHLRTERGHRTEAQQSSTVDRTATVTDPSAPIPRLPRPLWTGMIIGFALAVALGAVIRRTFKNRRPCRTT